jgi:hypothetical protein
MDWGLSFRLANTGQPAEKVPGYTTNPEMHGWSEVDLIMFYSWWPDRYSARVVPIG